MAKKLKLAILGANEFQTRLILRAKELGFETHVFSWERGEIGEQEADFFYLIDVMNKAAVLEKCRSIGIDGISSIASDVTNITVHFVRRKMGMEANSSNCLTLTTIKNEMRDALQKANCPIPKYQLIADIDDIDTNLLVLPSIVKPSDRSGSRGISLVEDAAGISTACKLALDESFSNTALVEEFVEGREFSVESFSQDGVHKVLQLTEKFTTGAPQFIERAHLAPARVTDQERLSIEEVIKKALTALDVKIGCSHSEIKIKPSGEIKIIEIGSRMGGDFIGSDLVANSTGINFLDLEILSSLNLSVNNVYKVPECSNKNMASLSFFLFDIKDKRRLSNLDAIVDVQFSGLNKSYTGEVNSSNERFGYSVFNLQKQKLDFVLNTLGLN